jgi:apolipoprotein N-acyltransferase
VRARAYLPFVSAALLWAAFPPVGAAPLAWMALAPLVVFLEREPSRRRRWLLAFAFGWAFGTAGLYWLAHVLLIAPPLVGLYFGLVGWGFALAYRALRAVGFPVMFATAAGWTAMEWSREWLFTGLPYIFVGHASAVLPSVAQIADLAGVPGVTFVLALGSGAVASVWLDPHRRRWWLPPAVACAATVAAGIYGVIRRSALNVEEVLDVAVVQPNIAQEAKWELDPQQVFTEHRRWTDQILRAPKPPDMIVWPEVSFTWPIVAQDGRWSPYAAEKTSEERAHEAIMYMRTAGAPILFGATVVEFGDRNGRASERRIHEYVSALLVGPAGIAGRYDKERLVPFGEYVPLSSFFPRSVDWIRRWTGFALVFSAGTPRPPVEVAGRRLGMLVCFEALFPSLARARVQHGADVLVNLSNEAWFRESAEMEQMLASCMFRAIETRRGMVRCTNTGISAILDPDGSVRAVVADGGRRRGVAGIARGAVRSTRDTTLCVRCGWMFGPACGLSAAVAWAVSGAGFFLRRRKESRAP